MEQKNKIKNIIKNMRNGNIYIITYDNNLKKQLYKDEFGYYVYINKQIKLVKRFDNIEDLNIINKVVL